MPFLSQAMSNNGGHAASHFIDSIVLATISGRCSSHLRNTELDRQPSNLSEELRQRHQWLDKTLSSQITKILAATDDEETMPNETMILFTTMMALATSLSQHASLSAQKQDSELAVHAIRPDEAKAFESVHHIADLAQRLAEFSWYKVRKSTIRTLIQLLFFHLLMHHRFTH